ncbi:anti-sigma factor antagonist [Actinoplanes teichomyceticus]|uniref:Anti-sigma factor antagonist n=1 Tax=Actinoplanes teichomyceticus TaxID=1867 RepID=A0A561WKM4_ACTTI|nr:anti-sigma factor antagonist [Actinoplanes teichomyceticus]TWG24426.1 anti-anti-sigma factor [Actinoplanes teichomyceticus]GIF12724.1 anti-sigma factor antagonist [Actinoplanes teichomyceticus]
MDEPLTVTTTAANEHIAVLAAAGEIDHDSRRVLSDAAERAIRRGCRRIVIDLTDVTFCDSGGLSLFVQLHKTTGALGGQLRLAGVQYLVAAAIQATNLDRLLLLHPTVDEAVAAALRH